MLKKNLLLYKEKFDSIAINQWQRIQDYLATKKINSKFQKNLYNRVKEILRIDTQTIKVVFLYYSRTYS